MTDSAENAAQHTQWGVEAPDGSMFTYSDPVIARIVSREQGKPVQRRTVTTTPWETDPDNVGHVTPPEDSPPHTTTHHHQGVEA